MLLRQVLVLAFAAGAIATAAKVTIGPHNIVLVDGKPAFPIGFMKGPPPGSKTPSGRDAYEELSSNGTVFHVAGPTSAEVWDSAAEAKLDRIMELSAKAGLLTAVSIFPLQVIGPGDQEKAAELRRIVRKYRQNAALGFWKTKDEPAWGKVSAAVVQRFTDIVRELDRNHPTWLIQAPRGTVSELRAYNSAADIVDTDIYPISYPPGIHSLEANRDISMVGDYAGKLREITQGEIPFFMTLQICWSGVTKPGKTLRMPTFPEERYMAYQAIIGGARGLTFFGGNVERSLNGRDRPLGWNWTFYEKVLRPVLAEFRPDSPLHPALLVPHSRLPVRADGVEFTVREAAGRIFILAAKREGSTIQTKFTGLPEEIAAGDVLFEEPRKIAVVDGAFTDWFGPNEVHVYGFAKPK